MLCAEVVRESFLEAVGSMRPWRKDKVGKAKERHVLENKILVLKGEGVGGKLRVWDWQI